MTNHLFELAGNRKTETVIPKSKKKWYQGKPVVSAAILILIVLGCLCAELIMTKDPAYMDLLNYNKAPDREFLFGTDTMGRDIFSMIWYGGRISILIGGLATVISTFIAVVVGAFSGVAPAWLDELIMRFTEIFLSIVFTFSVCISFPCMCPYCFLPVPLVPLAFFLCPTPGCQTCRHPDVRHVKTRVSCNALPYLRVFFPPSVVPFRSHAHIL